MVARLSPNEQDVRALAAVVSEIRSDLPVSGLPGSLLADLKDQIPCDFVLCQGYDTTLQRYWFVQQIPQGSDGEDDSGLDFAPEFREAFWNCQFCSYPDRTGDLKSIIKVGDFYSAREWRSSGMFQEVMRPQGLDNALSVCLSEPPGPDAGPGRSVRLFFVREPGPDFSERDRALLTLLRPHLQQAYHDAERQRSPVPNLTPRQWDLLHLIANGRTNVQIARQLGLSEGTVRTHLENIYKRLQVSNRTSAVVRAFPDRVA
jgi:DNA-binding CsgD family transcriptional regulator